MVTRTFERIFPHSAEFDSRAPLTGVFVTAEERVDASALPQSMPDLGIIFTNSSDVPRMAAALYNSAALGPNSSFAGTEFAQIALRREKEKKDKLGRTARTGIYMATMNKAAPKIGETVARMMSAVMDAKDDLSERMGIIKQEIADINTELDQARTEMANMLARDKAALRSHVEAMYRGAGHSEQAALLSQKDINGEYVISDDKIATIAQYIEAKNAQQLVIISDMTNGDSDGADLARASLTNKNVTTDIETSSGEKAARFIDGFEDPQAEITVEGKSFTVTSLTDKIVRLNKNAQTLSTLLEMSDEELQNIATDDLEGAAPESIPLIKRMQRLIGRKTDLQSQLENTQRQLRTLTSFEDIMNNPEKKAAFEQRLQAATSDNSERGASVDQAELSELMSALGLPSSTHALPTDPAARASLISQLGLDETAKDSEIARALTDFEIQLCKQMNAQGIEAFTNDYTRTHAREDRARSNARARDFKNAPLVQQLFGNAAPSETKTAPNGAFGSLSLGTGDGPTIGEVQRNDI